MCQKRDDSLDSRIYDILHHDGNVSGDSHTSASASFLQVAGVGDNQTNVEQPGRLACARASMSKVCRCFGEYLSTIFVNQETLVADDS